MPYLKLAAIAIHPSLASTSTLEDELAAAGYTRIGILNPNECAKLVNAASRRQRRTILADQGNWPWSVNRVPPNGWVFTDMEQGRHGGAHRWNHLSRAAVFRAIREWRPDVKIAVYDRLWAGYTMHPSVGLELTASRAMDHSYAEQWRPVLAGSNRPDALAVEIYPPAGFDYGGYAYRITVCGRNFCEDARPDNRALVLPTVRLYVEDNGSRVALTTEQIGEQTNGIVTAGGDGEIVWDWIETQEALQQVQTTLMGLSEGG